MMRAPPDAARSPDRGSAVVELVLVAPVFFALLFGIIFVGMMLWTWTSLHFAAQSAARCAAINTGVCSSATAVKNFALSRYYGLATSSSAFNYSNAGCGNTVTGNYTFTLAVPFAGSRSVSLTASACFPSPPS